jgi:glucose/arabinose dehydrogenase
LFFCASVLYMSVGAPCNVCLSPPLVSAIVRMKPDGSGMESFAEGVRNSVGFDWRSAHQRDRAVNHH